MSKNLGVKPFIFPLPILLLVTYNEDGSANAMTAAWATIVDRNEILISLAEHKTTENLAKNPYLTISIGDADHVVACDYLGVISGDKVPNKLEKAGLTTRKSESINAPIINEMPLTLECKFSREVEEGLYVFEILNVIAEERILDEQGKVDVSKLKPISYDESKHGYYVVSEKVGQAFSDGFKIK